MQPPRIPSCEGSGLSISREQRQLLHDNLVGVRARIDRAAEAAGRPARDIRLIGITKYVPAEMAVALAKLGLGDLGESRPQELWDKAAVLPAGEVRWHLVGQLQRNKIRRTLPLVHLIHSVDNLRLLEAIDRIAVELDRQVDVLLEVNVSGDAAKQGVAPDGVASLLDKARLHSSVRIRGLMCMAGLESDAAETRRQFAALRELHTRLGPQVGPEFSELSMGMSDDFEIAIAEGATLVRIGSLLFQGLA